MREMRQTVETDEHATNRVHIILISKGSIKRGNNIECYTEHTAVGQLALRRKSNCLTA